MHELDSRARAGEVGRKNLKKKAMTKSNSLRSLKKRRRSVDKRGSVKKERNRFNKKIPEEHHSGSPEAGPEEAVVSNEPEKSQQDNKDFTPWWNSSTLTDFYSWCQSTVTEVSIGNHKGIIIFELIR